MRPGTTADDAPGMAKRRKEADEVSRFFNVPWSRGLGHICAAGCCGVHNDGPCASRTKAVEKAKHLARLLLSPPVTEPAANKYTRCDPCVRSVAIIAWFHGLVRKAIGRKLKRQEESSGHAAGPAGADVVDYDAAIGVPRDPMGHERKIGGIKLNKVYYFLSHGKTKYVLLVFLVVSRPLFHVHYFLFKQGTWKSHRPDDRACIFDFVGDATRNCVARAIGALAQMLLDPDGSGRTHLRLMALVLGRDSSAWPLPVTRALHVNLIIAICMLWRLSLIHI